MKDGNKTKKQLINELIELHKLIAESQTSITERKRAEEELRFHSEIMQNMAEGVYLTRTENGIIVYTNPKFEKMFGYRPGEMIGKHVSIVNAPTAKSPEKTAKEIMGILDKTGTWQGEVKNVKKDGTPFWCYATVSVFNHPEHGKVWISVHTDITERKQVEHALRKSNEKYRSLFEDSPISLWEEDFSDVKAYIDNLRDSGVKDFRTYFENHPEAVVRCAAMVKIVDVNKATLKLYKAKSEEEFLKGLGLVFAEESYDAFREELIAIAEGKTTFEIEAINRTLTGDKVHIISSVR